MQERLNRSLAPTTSTPVLPLPGALRSAALVVAIYGFGLVHLYGLPLSGKLVASLFVIALAALACHRRGGLGSWLVLMLGVWVFLELRA
jgi:hypothetical protein